MTEGIKELHIISNSVSNLYTSLSWVALLVVVCIILMGLFRR